jgi:DNA-binding response OmpR family regulator
MVPMLPSTLALVDDDHEYREYLVEHLQGQGVRVESFGDSNLLLARASAYDYGFYVLDLMLPGVDGIELIKVLRLRTQAGILVVSGRLAPDVFDQVLSAGADMYLAKPVTFRQVTLAVETVQRRVASVSLSSAVWQLDRRARQLVAPDGAPVDLSDGDMKLMDCFLGAAGAVVSRDALHDRMGHEPGETSTDAVYAAIFRLRRRIERATPGNVPLQAKARVGYLFKAPLKER